MFFVKKIEEFDASVIEAEKDCLKFRFINGFRESFVTLSILVKS